MTPFANAAGITLLALLPLLLLLALLGRLRTRRREALWGGSENIRRMSSLPAREWDTLSAVALWTCLALTLFAFARPQWGEVSENVQRVGLDVVTLLDVSRSMTVDDLTPSRLNRAKMELRSFLTTNRGDRVGLVAFGGVSLALSPLTRDLSAISMLLDIADEHLIPVQGTDLGRGFGKALALFDKKADRDRVILLFSDGEDMGEGAAPAARMANKLGVKLFCIGVGTPSGGTVTNAGGKPVLDPDTGLPAVSRLDESSLRSLASLTDGRYWTLSDSGGVVSQILEEFSRLKRKEYATRSRLKRHDQFAWFLASAAALLLLVLLIPERRRGASPKVPFSLRATVSAGVLLLSLFLATPARAESPSSLADRAGKAFAGGDLPQALALYRRALSGSTSPRDRALLHFDVGTCLLAGGDARKAADEFTLALSSRYLRVQNRALYNLAQALYDLGETDKALASLRALLVSDPANNEARLFYEWILRNRPENKPPPPDNPPKNPPPRTEPPDVLKQLPMPVPKELQDQLREPAESPPGMKPW